MATPLDIKRVKAEYLRVQANMAEMEVRIEDHLENIARLETSIKTSKARMEELSKNIKDMESPI